MTNKSVILLISLLSCFAISEAKDKPSEQPDTEGFVSIFDGKTLDGWEGDPVYWRAENGVLIGEVTPDTILKRNTFIIWRGDRPNDFELKLEYRITADGNSGINYRSEEIKGLPLLLKGYQCDIDGHNTYTGQNYEERGRTTLAYHGQRVQLNELPEALAKLPIADLVKHNAWTQAEVVETLGEPEELNKIIHAEAWNTMHVIANGNKLQHYVNGVLMSEVIDNDLQHRKLEGFIGVQVHVGPPMKVEYRNIRLKQL